MFGKFYEYSSIIALYGIGIFFGVLIFVCFSGCTLTVTTLHTQGTASDVVDETQNATPTINTTLDVPLLK